MLRLPLLAGAAVRSHAGVSSRGVSSMVSLTMNEDGAEEVHWHDATTLVIAASRPGETHIPPWV